MVLQSFGKGCIAAASLSVLKLRLVLGLKVFQVDLL